MRGVSLITLMISLPVLPSVTKSSQYMEGNVQDVITLGGKHSGVNITASAVLGTWILDHVGENKLV